MVEMVDPNILNPRVPKSRDHFFLIHMATKSRFPSPYFLVINRRMTEAPTTLKCIGVWLDKNPSEEEVAYEPSEVKDVMIPWEQIAFIESTQYNYKR